MSVIEIDMSKGIETKDKASFGNPGTMVKLENSNESFAFQLVMILPDNIMVCKSINRATSEGFAIGSLVNFVSQIENGSCVTPVQITAIGHQAELVAVKIMGKSQNVQRRMFARVKTGVGVQLKLQIDNHTSRYKSLEVSDLSVDGVGVTIYSKSPIATGQYARLEIQLPTVGSNNRINARGQIMHCSPQNSNRLAYLLGVKFTELDDVDQKKIIEYVTGLQEHDKSSKCSSPEFSENQEESGTKNQGRSLDSLDSQVCSPEGLCNPYNPIR